MGELKHRKRNSKESGTDNKADAGTLLYSVDAMQEMKRKMGLTCEEIRDKSGLSLSTVQKVMGGIVTSPTRATRRALSQAFAEFLREEVAAGQEYTMPSEGLVFSEPSPYHAGGNAAAKNAGGYGSVPRTGYTYEDYYKLELPEGQRVELIDGVLYDMGAPTLNHQMIAFEIGHIFRSYIKENKGGCKVLIAPTDVRLEYDRGDRTVVQPDLLVICDTKKQDDMRAIKGAPDFVLEVVSPSSRKMDLNRKMKKYRECGVYEYWIVDYDSDSVIKTLFERDGKPESSAMYTMEDAVPVEIYGGKLIVDFKEIAEYLQSW